MPDIAPFKAYYFNAKNRKDLEEFVAPPHDVISDAERSAYFRKTHENIVRIILPDSYFEAAQILKSLISNKRLIQQESPVFYIYETKFKNNNEIKKRYGLIALVKLSEFSEKQILPHEKTFEKVAEERLNLFRETNANFNPIFFIFNGTEEYTKIIQKNLSKPPFLAAIDRDGVEHTVWVIDNAQEILTLQNFFKPIPLVIADGHHRYTSSLSHSREKGSKYILSLLVDINDPGLFILPTHRMIRHVPQMTTSQILNVIKKYFDVKTYDLNQLLNKKIPPETLIQEINQMDNKIHNTFGLLLYKESNIFIITLKAEFPPESLLVGKNSNDWKRLDISILHEFVLNKLLKIPQFIDDSDNIVYVKSSEEAIENISNGLYQIAFILNPTKKEQVLKITEGAEIMPHKSTYFYPKPLSGLLIYKWNPDEEMI
ncbi:MAG TPA: DUF1015 domain-containing protein [Candidatus Deferrimicrobium sp.]|nr:DUF1015 domain-containing protein [Candidatus Deferrimicrobium sp.]